MIVRIGKNDAIKILLSFAIAICAIVSVATAQPIGADTVVYYKFGGGDQTTGQGPEYFPANVFGFPDTAATEYVPAVLPESVCSLGLGGEIVIGFKDYKIIDGPGVDFIVFENAFYSKLANKLFAEPAVVSVSMDGVDFFEIPFDINTLEGCAGTRPTKKHNGFDWDTSQCGGTGYDLADFGIQQIRFIRLVDTSGYLLAHPEHKFYDATISGFDLDAIVGLYPKELVEMTSVIEQKNNRLVKISQNGDIATIECNGFAGASVRMFSANSEMVYSANFNGRNEIRLSQFPSGVYFAVAEAQGQRVTSKILIVH